MRTNKKSVAILRKVAELHSEAITNLVNAGHNMLNAQRIQSDRITALEARVLELELNPVSVVNITNGDSE